MIFQRYIFYQNAIRLGRGDSWTYYPPERIDYAGDASVGAAENGDAVFDGTEGRGGKVLAMPAHYAKAELAERGAVERFFYGK